MRISIFLILSVLVAGVLAFSAVPVEAGFQWKPPSEMPAVPTQPVIEEPAPPAPVIVTPAAPVAAPPPTPAASAARTVLDAQARPMPVVPAAPPAESAIDSIPPIPAATMAPRRAPGAAPQELAHDPVVPFLPRVSRAVPYDSGYQGYEASYAAPETIAVEQPPPTYIPQYDYNAQARPIDPVYMPARQPQTAMPTNITMQANKVSSTIISPPAAPAPPPIPVRDSNVFSINPYPFTSGSVTEGMPVLGVTPLEAQLLSRSDRAPAASRYAPPVPASRPAMAASMAPKAGYEETVGFGEDLPLSLAVSQVVPEDFEVSYDSSADQDAIVSWEGGKPWNEVMQDMLQPLGLSASITSQKVMISAAARAAPPVSRYTPPPPPPVSRPAPVAYTPPPVIEPRPLLQNAAVAPNIPRRMGVDGVTLWQAPRGASLRDILSNWSLQAGVELYWASEYDFPLESTVRLSGSFEDAVQNLLTGLNYAQPRPIGRLHPNLPDGPAVLVIETRHVLK